MLFLPGTTIPHTFPQLEKIKSQALPSSLPSATFMTLFLVSSANEYWRWFILNHIRRIYVYSLKCDDFDNILHKNRIFDGELCANGAQSH